MQNQELSTIKFIFLSASNRSIYDTMKLCKINDFRTMFNETMVAYKKISLARETGKHIIALDPDTDQPFEIENLTADYSREESGIASITLSAQRQDYLRAFFKTPDVSKVFTDAFYSYDRLVDVHSRGFRIAIVDDPKNITKIEYLEPGHMIPNQ